MEAQERTDVGLFGRVGDHFSETFGTEAEIVMRTNYGVEVAAGEMSFLFDPMRKAYRLWGECPECGWHCWSCFFKTLGGLGEMLTVFSPDSHRCGALEVVEDDAASALRKAFRAFMMEEE